MLLIILLVILAIAFLGGGFGVRGHQQYGSFSGPGIGLGGILIIVLAVLVLSGTLRLS